MQEIGTHKPLILKTRLTSHIRPKKVSGVQDYQHPSENEVDYNNQIVGVLNGNKPGWSGFSNIMMSNGNHGKLEYDS